MNEKKPAGTQRSEITTTDYQTLSDFRYLLRCFLEFSEKAARKVGIQPRQHQALLAIKGIMEKGPVTIGDLAERLRIRHHSAVELVNRLGEADLVVRQTDTEDQRRVILHLTERAEAHLAKLSAAHLDELSRIEPMLTRILSRGKD
ncbi:MarR family winged helix-turn-helix transcriptional regulator [Mesorhizobium sp. A623]